MSLTIYENFAVKAEVLSERYGATVQISFSTKSIHGLSRIGSDPYSVLDKDAYGITVDAETFCGRNVLEYHGVKAGGKVFDTDAAAERFAAFIRDCKRSSVHLCAMRAPRLRWDTKRTDLNELMLQTGKECISACAGKGCGYIVIQPLFSGIAGADLWQENHRYYSALGKMAKQTGIQILMENQCRNTNGHLARGVCADAVVAAEWIDKLNEESGAEVFGFCLDTGACSLCRQDMGEMAAALGRRVKAVLVRECDGVQEASRLPFTGRNVNGQDVDWKSLVRGLRKTGFDGILIMDAGDTLKGFSHLLRPQVYPLIRSVAEYLKWQIGMEKCIRQYPVRVLFGAGNMCRQYMTCYGQQYPPLFISDNNPGLWGTMVYGVEVRPPEVLKELPEGCVVIICNTFYEETAGQLKALGVSQIGTFSDECLPGGMD